MNRRTHLCWLVLSLFVIPAALAADEAEDKKLDERVREAVRKGVEYLKQKQGEDGSWEQHGLGLDRWEGGLTSLALLALLESGVNANDEVIVKGLKCLRAVTPKSTYVVSLQTMVFCRADPKKDTDRIRQNADWLVKTARRYPERKPSFSGWGYGAPGFAGPEGSDHSNTQFAVMALHAASEAGAKVPDTLWEEIRELYLHSQAADGGWPYNPALARAPASSITMTSAGIAGLLIGEKHVKKVAATERALSKAFERLGEAFTFEVKPWRYYNTYGIARVGRLSGKEIFAGPGDKKHDWYREGARFLLKEQTKEGCWKSDSPIDGNPIIATSFSLLFLSKGK